MNKSTSDNLHVVLYVSIFFGWDNKIGLKPKKYSKMCQETAHI